MLSEVSTEMQESSTIHCPTFSCTAPHLFSDLFRTKEYSFLFNTGRAEQGFLSSLSNTEKVFILIAIINQCCISISADLLVRVRRRRVSFSY